MQTVFHKLSTETKTKPTQKAPVNPPIIQLNFGQVINFHIPLKFTKSNGGLTYKENKDVILPYRWSRRVESTFAQTAVRTKLKIKQTSDYSGL